MNDEDKKLLQRRIKNQRKELKRLNTQLLAKDILLRTYITKWGEERKIAYRHAAHLAEGFFMGKRIAAYIRRWL